jgi:predicted PurR-regulated permease PerM/DNA-binding MarR family transcriptional regulator
MPATFNNRLRQIILLLVIILLALLLLNQLYVFLPGFLGAITLYILFRESYYRLTIVKKRNKTITALLFIFLSLIVIALPIYFSINLLTSQISEILSNPMEIMKDAKIVGNKIYDVTGIQLLTEENIAAFQKKATTIVPTILNSSANILSNFAIMFFLLYFLLQNGRQVEKFLDKFIPLKEENIDLLSNETKNMIKANAIGIPVLAIIQGVIAAIGYTIFGVKDWGLWAFLTGVFSMVPIVGTAIIWIPLTLYLYATGNSGQALGLLIYSVVLITNVDYVARLTILKKLMDVHPLVTIFGVIVGIGLFGFWGVIFGPLLISYFIILVKIYITMSLENDINQPKFRNEFQKASINIIFTFNWLTEKTKGIFEKEGLTSQQFNILRILRGAGAPLSTLQIRQRMLDKMSDTSRIVDRLIIKGLVKKTVSKIDKRLVDVSITDKGKKVLAKLDKCEEQMDAVIKTISEAEAKTLNNILDKMRKSD